MAKLSIVKCGGKVLDEPALRSSLLEGFVKMPGPKILVHGGGRAGARLAERLGIASPVIEGRRITSDEMLEVAIMVYGGLMNRQLVAELQALGAGAMGFAGADLDLIRAHKRPVGRIDYGWAGDIEAVRADKLHRLLDQEIVPVLAPLTHDGQGQLLNTNADTIAATVASAMCAHYTVRLIYAFEKPGVLLDPDDDGSLIPQLTRERYARYRQSGQIAGGMIPKLDNAFAALEAGVEEVWIGGAAALGNWGKESFRGTLIGDIHYERDEN